MRRNASDTVGELSLRIKVAEEVVLPSKEYEPMLQVRLFSSLVSHHFH